MFKLKQDFSICGAPFVSLDNIPADTSAAIIGVASSLGSPHHGPENGPYFIRRIAKTFMWSATKPRVMSVDQRLPLLERVIDLGDIGHEIESLNELLLQLEGLILSLPENTIPCLIGGDHSITLASVKALQKKRSRQFCVIQFDHHLDLQIWEGSLSSPEKKREDIFNTNVMSHVADALGPGSLFQIGVSPFATVEEQCSSSVDSYFQKVGHQIPLFSSLLNNKKEIKELIGSGKDIYISVDVDVLESSQMSSTGYPSTVGLSINKLLEIIEICLEDNHIVGFDVVEFAAPKESRDLKVLGDAERVAHIFLHLLSRATRPRHQYQF